MPCTVQGDVDAAVSKTGVAPALIRGLPCPKRGSKQIK